MAHHRLLAETVRNPRLEIRVFGLKLTAHLGKLNKWLKLGPI
jgi:hypothetical protein